MRSVLVQRCPGWLSGVGREDDVVISSRARLARNLSGFPFLHRIAPAQRREVESVAREAVLDARLADDMEYHDLRAMAPVERHLLVERRLISKELAGGDHERGVAVGAGETLSIMVNEEDHLRIQALRPGLDLEGAWRGANEADDALARRVRFAFSEELGYLTACPTNVGTGLRVSVMLHLPALAMSRHIEKVFNAVVKLNLVVRGLYGEGTQAAGDLYQVSNQRTLGRTEEEIIAGVAGVVPQIARYERQVREALLRDAATPVADQAWRAYGLLANARSMTSEEALYLLSRVRLGVHLGLLDALDVSILNRLLLFTQPAHVQQLKGERLDAEERNVVRADLVRDILAGKWPREES